MADAGPDAKRQRLDSSGEQLAAAEPQIEEGQQQQQLDDDGEEPLQSGDEGEEEEGAEEGEEDLCALLGIGEDVLLTYQEQQTVLDQVQEECSEAILQVEHSYARKKRPLLTQRSDLLRAIPGFWKKVLESHPTFKQYFTDADLAVLDYLLEVDVDDSEDPTRTGWKIRLVFGENPYFDNTEVVKEYRYPDDASPLVSTCTELRWREGKAPLTEEQQQALGSKRASPGDNDYNFINNWLKGEPEGVFGGSDPLAELLREEIWPNPLAVLQHGAAGLGLDGEGEGDDDELQQQRMFEEGGEYDELEEDEELEEEGEGVIEIDDDEDDDEEGGADFEQEGYEGSPAEGAAAAAAAAGDDEDGGTTGAGADEDEEGYAEGEEEEEGAPAS